MRWRLKDAAETLQYRRRVAQEEDGREEDAQTAYTVYKQILRKLEGEAGINHIDDEKGNCYEGSL